MTATADTLMLEAELARAAAVATGLEAQRADRVHQASLRAARAVAQARSLAWSTHAPHDTADELEAAFHAAVHALATAHDAAIAAAIERERARLAYVQASMTGLEAGWAHGDDDGTVQSTPTTERIRR